MENMLVEIKEFAHAAHGVVDCVQCYACSEITRSSAATPIELIAQFLHQLLD